MGHVVEFPIKACTLTIKSASRLPVSDQQRTGPDQRNNKVTSIDRSIDPIRFDFEHEQRCGFGSLQLINRSAEFQLHLPLYHSISLLRTPLRPSTGAHGTLSTSPVRRCRAEAAPEHRAPQHGGPPIVDVDCRRKSLHRSRGPFGIPATPRHRRKPRMHGFDAAVAAERLGVEEI